MANKYLLITFHLSGRTPFRYFFHVYGLNIDGLGTHYARLIEMTSGNTEEEGEARAAKFAHDMGGPVLKADPNSEEVKALLKQLYRPG